MLTCQRTGKNLWFFPSGFLETYEPHKTNFGWFWKPVSNSTNISKLRFVCLLGFEKKRKEKSSLVSIETKVRWQVKTSFRLLANARPSCQTPNTLILKLMTWGKWQKLFKRVGSFSQRHRSNSRIFKNMRWNLLFKISVWISFRLGPHCNLLWYQLKEKLHWQFVQTYFTKETTKGRTTQRRA